MNEDIKSEEYLPYKCMKCGREHEIDLDETTKKGNFTFTCICGNTVHIGASKTIFGARKNG